MENKKTVNKSVIKVHGRNTLILVWLLTAMVICVGCSIFKESDDGDSLLYDICDVSMLPDELLSIIDSKKQEAFNLVYSNNTYTYIVMAAGKQERDDVGIEVEKMYRDQNAIYVKSILRKIATPGDTVAGDGISYPYTVLRIQKTDMPIIFK
ncbi:MAG: protease complex subunit PrcB family protein [Coprococcus sp.]